MTQLLEEETHLETIGDGRYRREIEEGPFWGMMTAHGGYPSSCATSSRVEDTA
ncbi:MAG: hypothetical protein JRG86_02065 [Deltaproteobacteria bacterium]|jgi:hypothetical protein|nr:hypothetical protein [Deltaproteobacteria bacterium]MBW2497090.1 hypothetical protein [Deltaproteobacteria bacterium]